MNPFDGNLLAIGASRNFGLKGSGRVFVVQLTGQRGEGNLIGQFDFKDGIFDLAWSEVDRDSLICGGGDGRVYKVKVFVGQETRAVELYSHKKEISSFDWCPLRRDKFLSTSWDGTIRIMTSGVLKVIQGHVGAVNEARWSPRQENLFLSVSGDCTARLWDDRNSSSVAVIAPSESLMVPDLLSLDWNKYEEWNVCTASPSDLLFWDLRLLSRGPVNRIPGAHRRAIKRVRFSPWQGNRLASVGFDMSLRSWDLTALNPRGAHYEQYTEFTTGLDWSNFDRNRLFTCSWDESVQCHFLQ